MRIALVGTRGVPASYSGFETCAEELGARLVARGHEVTVYCRSHHVRYPHPAYRGMRLVSLPSIPSKYLDTIVHAALSVIHAVTQAYDVVLVFIAGNSPVAWVPRVAGQKVVLNVDGLDWKRQKWPRPAKAYLRLAERLAARVPDAVVTDSRAVQRYYRERYGAETVYIAYGSDVEPAEPGIYLERFGLEPRGYVLFVGRLVPENCAHHLVEAFDGLDAHGRQSLQRGLQRMKCVILGDAPYARRYNQWLRASAGPDVVFTGYLFGDGYRELASHAYAFVETSEVGGTHPALIEAMAFGNCVVVNDTSENLETIGEAGLSYDGAAGASSLRAVLRRLIDDPLMVQRYRERAAARAREVYSWERIVDEYEALFRNLTR